MRRRISNPSGKLQYFAVLYQNLENSEDGIDVLMLDFLVVYAGFARTLAASAAKIASKEILHFAHLFRQNIRRDLLCLPRYLDQ